MLLLVQVVIKLKTSIGFPFVLIIRYFTHKFACYSRGNETDLGTIPGYLRIHNG